MHKPLMAFFLISFFLFILASNTLAEEEITITTYYPSPYGQYNQLATNGLAVGDANGNGSLDVGDQPNRDGDIRIKAQTGDPSTWPAGTSGQISYSSFDNSLHFYDGSDWLVLGGGGGGGSYTAWGTTVCAAGWTAAYTGYVTTHFVYTASAYDDPTNDYGWAWGAGGGSTFCSAASLAAGGTSSIFMQSSTNANSGRLSCAVCVK